MGGETEKSVCMSACEDVSVCEFVSRVSVVTVVSVCERVSEKVYMWLCA